MRLLVFGFSGRGGLSPVGLTGLDAGLVDAEPLNAELGHVGKPIHSNAKLLEVLVSNGYLPVIACALPGDVLQGSIYNVNADQMAVACATGFRADKLLFLTDVEGVRDGAGVTLETLTAEEARQLISGTGWRLGACRRSLKQPWRRSYRGQWQRCTSRRVHARALYRSLLDGAPHRNAPGGGKVLDSIILWGAPEKIQAAEPLSPQSCAVLLTSKSGRP